MRQSSQIKTITVLTLLGIVLTFAFQVLSARALGPSEFSLFAAFLAIINIAAIGSGALQNAVTVQVASENQTPEHSYVVGTRLKLGADASLKEALYLGFAGLAAVALMSGALSEYMSTSIWMPIFAALTIPFSFLFSRDVGVLQGSGNSKATVGWSTLSAFVRLLALWLIWAFALGVWSLMAACVISLAIVTTGAHIHANKYNVFSTRNPFDRNTIAVFIAVLSFAYLTNIDLVYVRLLVPAEIAGNFAVIAGIVKTGLIVPGTLSLMFLHRMASNRDDGIDVKRTVKIVLLIAFATVATMTLALGTIGPSLIAALFGPQYLVTPTYLVAVSLAYAPWIIAQGLMIRTNAIASTAAAVLLVCVGFLQIPIMLLTLPNIESMLWGTAILGTVCAGCLGFIALRRTHL